MALTPTPGQPTQSTGVALWAGRVALGLGIIFVALGLGLLVLFGTNSAAPVTLLWGALLLVVYGFFEPDSVRALLGQGQLQAGTRAILQAVLVVAAVMLLNLVVKDRLGDKQLDMSKNKVNTLSEQTIQTVKALDKPVTATVWYSQDPREVSTQFQLLKRYHDLNSKFTVTEVGIQARVDLANSQHVTQPGTVVFTKQGTPDPQVTTEGTEQGFTNALIGLVTNTKPKVYFLTGHGEGSTTNTAQDGYSTMAQQLGTQAITVAPLQFKGAGSLPGSPGAPLAAPTPTESAAPSPSVAESPSPAPAPSASSEASPAASPGASPAASPSASTAPSTGGLSVPADADVVVVLGPKSALSKEEIAALGAYADRGGRLLLSSDPFTKSNLNDFMSRYGLKFGGGIVLDQQQFVQNPLDIVFTSYGQSVVSRGLDGLPTVLPFVTSIEGTASGSYTKTDVARTSNESCTFSDTARTVAQCQSSDKKGPFSVLATLEQAGVKSGHKAGRVVVVGGASFASNGVLASQQFGANNVSLMTNAINWLALRDRVTNIPARTLQPDSVFLTQTQHQLVLFGYPLFLPILIGAIGVSVWMRRR